MASHCKLSSFKYLAIISFFVYIFYCETYKGTFVKTVSLVKDFNETDSTYAYIYRYMYKFKRTLTYDLTGRETAERFDIDNGSVIERMTVPDIALWFPDTPVFSFQIKSHG